MTASNDDIFLKRMWVYQRERFPLAQYIPLISAFTFSAASYSRICRGEGGFIAWNVFLGGTATAVILFLLLRLFDEFKDAEEDAKYRSYRPVPRGLVSLREIRGCIVASFAVVLYLNALMDVRLLVVLTPALIYMLIMWREFFVAAWLRRHPVVYLLTHMLVMPLADFYTSGLDWVLAGARIPVGLLFFLLTTFSNGCVIEIGRKIRNPQDEEVGVDTYSRLWGGRMAASVWLFILGVTGALAFVCCQFGGYASHAFPWLVFFLLLSAIPAVRFILWKKNGRYIEAASGMWTLAMYLIVGGIPMLVDWVKND